MFLVAWEGSLSKNSVSRGQIPFVLQFPTAVLGKVKILFVDR